MALTSLIRKPRMASVLAACAGLLAVSAAGCSKEEAPPAPDSVKMRAKSGNGDSGARSTSATGSTSSGSTAQLPPGHPPISGAAPRATTPASSGEVPPGHPPVTAVPPPGTANRQAAASGPVYDVPAGWQAQTPKSSMRKAEFVLPKAEGDSEDGLLIMYYFGTGGAGAIDANIARWKGMFSTAEGNAVPDDQVKVSTTESNGLKATLLDVTGRYTDAMSGRPDRSGEDFRMLAAILDTPEGPYFFKAVGPAKTMAVHEKAFGEFIASMRM